MEAMLTHSASKNCKIYVGSIPAEATKDEIESFFSKFGRLRRVEMRTFLKKNSSTEINPGHCIVVASSYALAERILSKDHYFKGRKLNCQPYLTGNLRKKLDRENNMRRVVLKAVPAYVTEEAVRFAVRPFGEIDYLFELSSRGRQFSPTWHSKPSVIYYSLQFTAKEAAQKLLEKRFIHVEGLKIKTQAYNHEMKKNAYRDVNRVNTQILDQNQSNFYSSTQIQYQYVQKQIFNKGSYEFAKLSIEERESDPLQITFKPTHQKYHLLMKNVRDHNLKTKEFPSSNFRFNLLNSAERHSRALPHRLGQIRAGQSDVIASTRVE